MLPWPSGSGRELMIQVPWVRIQVLPVMGSHRYVDGASVGTRKMVSIVQLPLPRQVKDTGRSGTGSSGPGLPAFNEDLATEVQ